MTVQQQAYELINSLPDEKVELIVQVMISMKPMKEEFTPSVQSRRSDKSRKMKAFQRILELREECAAYSIEDYDVERASALEEKYGSIPAVGAQP